MSSWSGVYPGVLFIAHYLVCSSSEVTEDGIMGKQTCGHTLTLSVPSFYLFSALHTKAQPLCRFSSILFFPTAICHVPRAGWSWLAAHNLGLPGGQIHRQYLFGGSIGPESGSLVQHPGLVIVKNIPEFFDWGVSASGVELLWIIVWLLNQMGES